MIFKGLVLCFFSFLFFINADGDESHIDEFNAQHLIEVLNSEDPYFGDTFDVRQAYKGKWVHSKTKKEGVDDNIGKYDGDWSLDVPAKHGIEGDLGLTFKEKAKHRATTAKLKRKFTFKSSPLIVQYEASFQDGQECGGAYIKLYSEEKNLDLEQIHDKSPYTIMFGPDKCGSVSKIHFIFRHKNPKTGVFEEKHGKQPSNRFEEIFTDSKPHLFTLIVYPNNLYKILVDQAIAVEGSLLEDFTPPVNPPAEIDDPEDKKPEDWDDREKISDPSAVKPDDWDESEPRMISDMNAVKPENWLDNEPTDIVDPSAEKPDDWDEEMDGEWEAPLVPNPACEDAAGCGAWTPPEIPNPKYKGKYTPPLIPNPAYKGKWEPRRIPNPDFFEDKNPFMSLVPLSAVGFELWSMSANLFFDNILITDDENFAKNWADMTYAAKIKRINKGSATLGARLMKSLNNRPGWWITWAVSTVIVPIVGYGWYLWWRVKTEASLFSEVVEFTNKYPWLWAVYTLVMLLPVTLFVYFCFWSKQDTRDFLPCGPRIDEDDESPEAQHLMDKKDDAEVDEEQNESPEIKNKTSKSREGRESSEEAFDLIEGASIDEASADEEPTGDDENLVEEEKPELKKRKSRKHDD